MLAPQSRKDFATLGASTTRNREWILPLLLYIVFSYLLLCGLMAPSKLASVYLGGGEVVYNSNLMWWFDYAISTLHSNPLRLDLLFYPLAPGLHDSSLAFLLTVPITHLFGSVMANNIYVLASFAFSGFTMYLLTRRLVDSRPAAFLAGYLFTFSATHFTHGLSHIHVYSLFWVPLVILCYFRHLERPSLGRGSLLGSVFAFTALTSWTLAIMAILFCGLHACMHIRNIDIRSKAPGLLAGAGIASVLVTPALAQIIELREYPESLFGVKDSIFWSADLLAFITPSPFHKVLGAAVAPLSARFTGNAWEAAVYLGIVSLALCAIGLLMRPMTPQVKVFAWGALFFLVLALGPILQIGGLSRFPGTNISIPLPGWLMPHIPVMDMMRTPCRYGTMVMLCVSVVAAHGFAVLQKHRLFRKPSTHRALVFVVLTAAFLDSMSVFTHQSVKPTPDAYYNIGGNANQGALVEVPAIRSPLARRSNHNDLLLYYYEYQKHHHKPLVGGYFNRVNGAHERFMMSDPVLKILFAGFEDIIVPSSGSPLAHLSLKHGIHYVVLHKNWLTAGELDAFTGFLGNDYVDDGSVGSDPIRVYSFDTPKPDFLPATSVNVELKEGWYGLENWSGRLRWTKSSANFDVYSDHAVSAAISLTTLPVVPQRTLVVYVNGNESYRSTLEQKEWTTHKFYIYLRRGFTEIRLDVPEGPVRPKDIYPSSSDPRDLAIAIKNIQLTPVAGSGEPSLGPSR